MNNLIEYFSNNITNLEFKNGFLKFLQDILKYDFNIKDYRFIYNLNEIINEIEEKKENILKNEKIKAFSFCYFNIVSNMKPFNDTYIYIIKMMVALIFTTKCDKQKFEIADLDLKYELVRYLIKFNQVYFKNEEFLKFINILTEQKLYNEKELISILDEIIKKNICTGNDYDKDNIYSFVEFYLKETIDNTDEFELKKIIEIIVNLIFEFVPKTPDENDLNESDPNVTKTKDYFQNKVNDLSFKNGFLKLLNWLIYKKPKKTYTYGKERKIKFIDSIKIRCENLVLNEKIKYLSKFISTIENDYFVEEIYEFAYMAMVQLVCDTELNKSDKNLLEIFKYFERNIGDRKFKSSFLKFLKDITHENIDLKFNIDKFVEILIKKKEKLANSELIKMYSNDYKRKYNILDKSNKLTEYKIRMIFLIFSL